MGKACLVPCGYAEWGFVDRENCIMPIDGSATALADAIIWSRDNLAELEKIGFKSMIFTSKTSHQSPLPDNLNIS